MDISITNKFRKQTDKIDNKKLKTDLSNLIQKIKCADRLTKISSLKKLKGHKNYYRVKLGDYRVGLVIEKKICNFCCN